jgi:hypothetical protein
MGGLLIGLRRILVAVCAPDLRESLRRVHIGLGLLMASRTTHPSRPMHGSFKSFFIYVQGKERPVLIPLAEAGVFMAFQAFGVF